MKLKGKAKQKARAKARATITTTTPNGATKTVQSFGNGGTLTSYSGAGSDQAMYDDIRSQVEQGAQELLDTCSINFDFSLASKPVLITKKFNLVGTDVTVHLHTDKEFLKPVGDKYNAEFAALFQVFTKKGSRLVPITQQQLDDAGHDYTGETVIDKDDVLNRAVAALRLNATSQWMHNVAMHIAYEETAPDSGKEYYEGIDTYKIYRVWD